MRLDDLLAPLRGVPLLPGASCVGRHELFDQTDPVAVEYAIHTCRSCPALAACRSWFDALPAGERPVGVVAGTVNPYPRVPSRKRRR
ncbi:hypothetical protein BMW24_022985 [Mycobacterium heckeshornense]|uniref:Uncharacterized protein n=1 Tax=Mycobacterium heckeshornense TaxID=110505 RepID=A0A2G8AVB0_9MYCO|nr:hypothetical protein [Mycobacterium heckeshornense]KMV23264.1 hypothetical protein ACT16_06125 [Mycobacterium heckeshornense]MCV7032858.1 hypothetical protein [Mycobacterium heckeshornense]PIJ29468.1 hypothetical protein BMW24_022985 [Mycobacterium heckeshornense]BCO35501.1 hypothetical protein MHEC_19340 [Mycobacterium heckeshornense]